LAKIYIEGSEINVILALVKRVDYIFAPVVFVDNRQYYSTSAVEKPAACLIEANIFNKLIC
jgi:hypothetical protein